MIVEVLGGVITIAAVAGAVLNNQRRRACFGVWFASNVLSGIVHVSAGLYALSARDAVFMALCVHGWVAWGRARKEGVDA